MKERSHPLSAVGEGKVSPSECKILALKGYPQPVTKKGVRQFLGLAGYYRKYIQNYASHSVLLTDATRKSAPERVMWCDDMLNEFEYLNRFDAVSAYMRKMDHYGLSDF